MKRLGIVGARGYVGAELVRLLAAHSGFELALVSSRSLVGQRVSECFDHPSDLVIRNVEADEVSEQLDALVLALPNGLSERWVEALPAETVIVDVSADHRFDASWQYGLPEHNRAAIASATRIANPGCYATGMQVGMRPILDLLTSDVTAFGVSGFSGAGSTPSPKNDPEKLRDNLMPYKLVGHIHEREVTRHLAHNVQFMPHVAPFFRGITLTMTASVKPGTSREQLVERYQQLAAAEPLVQWTEEAPLVRDAVERHEVHVGGLELDEERGRVAVVATLDNLLKGAATQVLQNLNLACGFEELEGIQ